MSQEQIAAAGNVEVPAYLTLIKLGYQVECNTSARTEDVWIAQNASLKLMAGGCLELLGLHLTRSERGVNWRASDAEIDAYLKKFDP